MAKSKKKPVRKQVDQTLDVGGYKNCVIARGTLVAGPRPCNIAALVLHLEANATKDFPRPPTHSKTTTSK
jgi:hypothetical protein